MTLADQTRTWKDIKVYINPTTKTVLKMEDWSRADELIAAGVAKDVFFKNRMCHTDLVWIE